MEAKNTLSGCEIICIGGMVGDPTHCVLTAEEKHKCKEWKQYKAAIKEVVDYFFYEVGIVRLMDCQTMEECKSKLPNWQAKLKEWGIK